MSRIRRQSPSTITVELSVVERMLLSRLAEQLIEVLSDRTDPAMTRLLPNAYPDDPEASAEFYRFTADGLTERKLAGARAVLAAVSNDGPVVLTEPAPVQWLHAITDLRLTIANRLGIAHDGDLGRTDEAAMPLQHSYYWLGELQEQLVEALER
ncbi:DUF2017 family protein [Cryobacterium tepidiphilum]|uniref:DUF2017 family protein n=1 Tax=Cryobacterium tepidiphilum TaxID=2486026 RepID=UPI0011CD86AB|nr:DUF2017 family protein [Cryobacterium tepidiphilum]